jgi:hypothetical protein
MKDNNDITIDCKITPTSIETICEKIAKRSDHEDFGKFGILGFNR